MEAFRGNIRRVFFDDADAYPLSSTSLMGLIDQCQNLSVMEQENEILLCVMECFADIQARAHERSAIDDAKIENLTAKPFILRDISAMIARMAFGNTLRAEYGIYQQKAHTAKRILSYLARWWIPQQRNQGLRFQANGKSYAFRKIDDMLMEVWGEKAPKGKEKAEAEAEFNNEPKGKEEEDERC